MRHWYSPEGELLPEGFGLPSVTTILSVRHNPYLWAWRERVGIAAAELKRQESADIGNAVHGALERLVTGQEAGYDHPYVESFKVWREVTGPTDMQAEVFLKSDLHEYAGKTDLICKIDGEDWVLDWKTTNHLSDDCALQLAAYAEAYREMTGIVCRRGVLQLTDKIKRGYRFKEYTNENDFGVFMSHKAILDWLWEGKKPKDYGTILFDGEPLKVLTG